MGSEKDEKDCIAIGLDKQKILAYKCKYFLNHQF